MLETLAKKQSLINILKVVKKKKPDLTATDKLGRTCFHLAAGSGNTTGLNFTVLLLNYWLEKELSFKIPAGFVIPPV